ncbi:MAG: hypothetical protein QOI66_2151 [Myxococcales bacterium]|jgi:hypothetical protein|nr:hypothetical protein [Myxococcales bacterium]
MVSRLHCRETVKTIFIASGVIVLSVLAPACDDGGPGSKQAPSITTIAKVCGSQIGRDQRCNKLDGKDPAELKAACAADSGYTLFREDALVAEAGCFDTLACDLIEDSCLGLAVRALGVNQDQDELSKGCLTRAHTCNTFIDDYCEAVLVFTDDARAKVSACLAKTCDEAEVCFNNLGGR